MNNKSYLRREEFEERALRNIKYFINKNFKNVKRMSPRKLTNDFLPYDKYNSVCEDILGKDGSFRDEESLSKAIADSIKKEGPDGVWIIPSRKKILEELTEDAVFDTVNKYRQGILQIYRETDRFGFRYH
uniref:Uncharacterized protein n=1 Tax=Rhizophagus irregularis (strain DAOM 181602 / DAOM 197198 / MUCL 43194) TaxID=747089 RepID=U9SGS4_RHIID